MFGYLSCFFKICYALVHVLHIYLFDYIVLNMTIVFHIVQDSQSCFLASVIKFRHFCLLTTVFIFDNIFFHDKNT